MSIDWGKFDPTEGEAWGVGQGRCPNGEFNVKIASAVDEGGMLVVEFTLTEPADVAGRSVRATYVTDADKAGKSAKAGEVTMNLLRGMMQAAEIPRGAFPSKWAGKELGVEVVDDANPDFAKIKRYSKKINGPLGIKASAVKPAEAFDDDGIVF